MEVTCTNGHSQTIEDPTDEGWEYATRDETRIEIAQFMDGEAEVQRTVAVPPSLEQTVVATRRLYRKILGESETDAAATLSSAPACGS